MTKTPTRILSIAGSDSGGGAGIQADIKTITMLDGHAMTAITAITAQNSMGVQAVRAVPTGLVVAQIDSVLTDIGVDAIKIGMIGNPEIANAVADRLEGLWNVPIVFDPVMVSTSGAQLADEHTIAAFGRLMKLARLVTPNIPEMAALGGIEAVKAHGCAVLAKGGHGEGGKIIDQLVDTDGKTHGWEADRLPTRNTHGTGCTLSAAIATGLGQGRPLVEAVARGIQYVRLAISVSYSLGEGVGPVGVPSAA